MDDAPMHGMSHEEDGQVHFSFCNMIQIYKNNDVDIYMCFLHELKFSTIISYLVKVYLVQRNRAHQLQPKMYLASVWIGKQSFVSWGSD
jgi:hypothetical protein